MPDIKFEVGDKLIHIEAICEIIEINEYKIVVHWFVGMNDEKVEYEKEYLSLTVKNTKDIKHILCDKHFKF